MDSRIALPVVLILLAAASAARSESTIMGFPGVVWDLSADGSVGVGSGDEDDAIRWTADGGVEHLGQLPGLNSGNTAVAVSDDGSVVVGYGCEVLDPIDRCEAFRWTEESGLVGLGHPPGGWATLPSALSADGSTVVGTEFFWDPIAQNGSREAFRWSAAEGFVSLGGGWVPESASADGSVIVGHEEISGIIRWTAATGAISFGPGGAYDTSADGSIMVGYSDLLNDAFRWTEDEGFVSLGCSDRYQWCVAHRVSADGTVIVGESHPGTIPPFNDAFLWDPVHGMRELLDLFTNGYGFDLTGWSWLWVRALSADGRVLGGAGTASWIAELGPLPDCRDRSDNDGDGAVDTDDPGCPFPDASPENPGCDDGVDNDGDGLVDFDDPACTSNWPYWEARPCGLGAELALVVPLLGCLRGRRRGAHSIPNRRIFL